MKDTKDFSIMKVINESERAPWKKRIHDRICRDIERLPVEEKFSFQTVCRRIERLETRNFLNSYHRNVEQVNRSLINVYSLTEKGKNSLESYRSSLLEDWMENQTMKKQGFSENFIRDAFARRYGIPEDICQGCSLEFLRKTEFLTENYQETSALNDPSFLQFIDTLLNHSQTLEKKLGTIVNIPRNFGKNSEGKKSVKYLSLNDTEGYSGNYDNSRQERREGKKGGDGGEKGYRTS